LAAQPFLKDMAAQSLTLLAQDSMLATFKADEMILSEGGVANRFYLILEGQVRLESSVSSNDALQLQTLGPGDILGWSWLIAPFYLKFDARALTTVKAIFFYGTRVRALCEENHELGYELMKRVSEVVIKRMQALRRELSEPARGCHR
jgi:CRP-like cAMP-binding protein